MFSVEHPNDNTEEDRDDRHGSILPPEMKLGLPIRGPVCSLGYPAAGLPNQGSGALCSANTRAASAYVIHTPVVWKTAHRRYPGSDM